MPVELQGNVAANKTFFEPGFLENSEGFIRFEGEQSSIKFCKPSMLGRIECALRDHSHISVGASLHCNLLSIYAIAPNSSIQVGSRNYFNGHTRILAQEGAHISIGADCLFATDCEITCGDFHSIFDAATGERINLPKDISIDDHVWLGSRVTVLKGADIGRNSVVGLGSIVTKAFPAGCLIAGAPARLIRSAITWQR